MSCRLSGSPSLFVPHGTEMVGAPLKSEGAVNRSSDISNPSSRDLDRPLVVTAKGGVGIEGHASTSIESNI